MYYSAPNIICSNEAKRVQSFSIELCIGIYLSFYLVFSLAGGFNYFAYPLNTLLKLSPLDVLAAGCLIFSLVFSPINSRKLYAVLPYIFAVTYYYIVGLLNINNRSVDVGDEMRKLFAIIILILAVPVVLKNRESLKRFAIAVQIASFLSLVICILEIAMPDRVAFLSQNSETITACVGENVFVRGGGLLRNPNEMSTFFIFALLLSHWVPQGLMYFSWLVCFSGVLTTTSRGGAIFFILCITAVLLRLYFSRSIEDKKKSKAMSALLFIAFFVFCIVAFSASSGAIHLPSSFNTDDILPRLTRFSDMQTDVADGARLDLMKYWFQKAIDAPFFGCGIYSFQGMEGGMIGPHNMWLMLWGEVGLLFPVLFFGLLILSLFRASLGRYLSGEKLVIYLFWIVWLALTFKGHNQFEHRLNIASLAIIFVLPMTLSVQTQLLSKKMLKT